MFLCRLHLQNYRNFSQLNLEFSPLTLLLGNNAQGKSNLLEAIYFLATTKSFRAAKDSQLIRDSEQVCLVEGEVGDEFGVGSSVLAFGSEAQARRGDGQQVTKLEITMQLKEDLGSSNLVEVWEKKLKVNGVARRSLDYIGKLCVVYFTPEDINLVTGPPSLRRWYLDLSLAQIDKDYKKAISEYSAIITSRNCLLKKIREGLGNLNELEFWTKGALKSGLVVQSKRRDFFQALNKSEVLQNPEHLLGKFTLSYQESLFSETRLLDYQAREIAAGVSLIGPHRDDFSFLMDGKSLGLYGSRGEQRTAVLSLKLAQLAFIKQTKGIIPVLLLDDVFSELDQKHQEYVASKVGEQQTILSAVETEQLPQDFLEKAKLIRVENGTLFSLR